MGRFMQDRESPGCAVSEEEAERVRGEERARI